MSTPATPTPAPATVKTPKAKNPVSIIGTIIRRAEELDSPSDRIYVLNRLDECNKAKEDGREPPKSPLKAIVDIIDSFGELTSSTDRAYAIGKLHDMHNAAASKEQGGAPDPTAVPAPTAEPTTSAE